MRRLSILHDEIDVRVHAIVDAAPDWPCRRGCDDCCRSLAEPPRLTAAEWELLGEGLAALTEERRAAVHAAFAERLRGERLRVCPMLEGDACSVYASRPIACRTFGFYDARDGGRWCERIEARVRGSAEGGTRVWENEGLVLGNHDAIERRLRAAEGEERSVLDWYRERFGV